jgi:invasion protein IalB
MNNNIERLAIGGGALVLGLLLGWGLRGVATYNVATETTTPYQDWRTYCPPAATENVSCELMGDVRDTTATGDVKPIVARISVIKDFRNKENPGLETIALTLPLNVLLDPGVGLQIGKEPVKVFKYRTCNNVGCIAIAPLDETILDAMQSGAETRISFTGAQPNDKARTLTVSYNGFDDAHSAYKRGNSRRDSWFWRLF